MEFREKMSAMLNLVREKRPLIHHLTNYVTVNDCANVVLALGGSPVMADDIAEAAEMAGFASALVLNIGTLNARTVQSMFAAGKRAKELGIPVILDPVGIGATKLRTDTAESLIVELKPEVIRGNLSEIMVLAGLNTSIKGVDSLAGEQDGAAVAQDLAARLACVVAVTGKTDVVAGGGQVCRIDNGHPMLSGLTGTGCMATSLIGTFCGVTKDYFTASAAGLVSMGLAGELAQASLKPGEGIGTFRARLLDSVYNLNPEILVKEGKIQ